MKRNTMKMQLEIELPDETVAFYRAEVPAGGDLNAYLSPLASELLQSLCECERQGGPLTDHTEESSPKSGKTVHQEKAENAMCPRGRQGC